MSPEAEMKIFTLCRGKTIKQVEYRLEVLNKYIAAKQLGLRCRIATLKIGD